MHDLIIGGNSVDAGRVNSILSSYATEHSQSVFWYDLGGVGDIRPSDRVTPEDIGRMTLLNPRLSGVDAALLIELGDSAPWDLVPHDAQLGDAVLVKRCALYDDALELHNHFASRNGISDAKASKLLHIKRPWLYPVLDKYVKATYEMYATAVANVAGRGKQSYWEAMRLDLRSNADALGEIQLELRAREHDVFQNVARLPQLRLLDIVAWRLGQQLPGST